MKHLFKSAFFSFLSNRFAIISLTIIIILSTGAFTLLQSTSNTFNNSWNNTILKGNLHDFTAKQKYTVTGSIDYKYSTSNDQPTIKTIDVDAEYIAQGDYVDAAKSILVDKKIVIPIIKSNEYDQVKQIIEGGGSKYPELANVPTVKDQIDSITNNIEQLAFQNKDNQFKELLKKDTQINPNQSNPNLTFRQVDSLSVSTSTGYQYKLVDTLTGVNNIDSTIIYNGSNVVQSTTQDDLKKQALEVEQRMKDHPTDFGLTYDSSTMQAATFNQPDTHKDYAVVITGTLSVFPLPTIRVVDQSAYYAVVSPSYAKKHDLIPVDQNKFNIAMKNYYDNILVNAHTKDPSTNIGNFTISDYLTYLTSSIGQKSSDYAEFSDSIVMVDATPYLVSGIGTTPDFAFPIIDEKSPVPNDESQAILFVNHNGYRRIQDAFRGNSTENYIAFKYKSNLSNSEKTSILNRVESLCKQNMSWPSNIRIANKFDDTSNETVLMAQQRISFLESLRKTINTITYVIIILMSLLTGFITIIIVKRQISSKRKVMATLLANGYQKSQIAASLMIIGFIVGAVPSIFGYLIGLFLQPAFINIFQNYWTIPAPVIGFSWISLVFTAIVPIVSIGLLAFLVALYEQRGKVVDALNGVDSKSSDFLTRKIMAFFTWSNIRTKLAMSLFSTNLSRMIMIVLASSGSVAAASIAVTTIGKFTSASSQTAALTNYSFKMNFVSPTLEGGQYALGINENPYKVANDVTQALKDTWKTNEDPNRVWTAQDYYYDQSTGKNNLENATSDYLNTLNTEIIHTSYMHLPNSADATLANGWQSSTSANDIAHGLEYLNNKVQTKGLLNAEFIGANPWSVARSLMPDNQSNYSTQMEYSFFENLRDNNKIWSKYKTSQAGDAPQWWKDVNADGIPSPQSITTPISEGLPTLWPSYVNVYKDGLDAGYNPYLIAYNQITSEVNDETFTAINGTLNRKNINKNNVSDSIEITGINKNSSYINLKSSQYDLLEKNKPSNIESQPIPVLANQYFLAYYNYSVGDTFKLDINNKANRYMDPKSDKTQLFKIVGQVNSFAGSQIFTLRNYANNSLGLSAQGFNGLFTKSEKPRALDSISLYSPSGIYPGFDTFIANDANTTGLLEKLFASQTSINSVLAASDTKNGQIVSNNEINKGINATVNNLQSIYSAAIAAQGGDPIKNAVNIYLNRYSNSIYQSTTSTIQWAKMDEYTFTNLMNLSSQLIWIIEGICLLISLLFIIVTATMLYDSNRKTIATLKVMGYTNKEIHKIVLKSFLPAIIFGVLLSIPFTLWILHLMQLSIMSFGKIFVPLNMVGWEIPIAAVAIIGIFLLVYLMSIRGMKNREMLEAFSFE